MNALFCSANPPPLQMDVTSFDPDLIRSIFTTIWNRKKSENLEENDVVVDVDDNDEEEEVETIDVEGGAGTSKNNNRSTTADSGALKLSCELLRLFVTEAVERASLIAEAEGHKRIEASHLERVLPQLLLDF